MKTNRITLAAAGLLMFAASSCDGAWTPPAEGEGSLDLGTMTVTNDDAEKLVSSSASRADGEDLSQYTVRIRNKATSAIVKEWKYADMPEVIEMPVGDYTVTAESHDVQPAEWDKPYYLGSADFTIESGKITNIGEVSCKFSSIKVTVVFEGEIIGYVGADSKVTIEAGDTKLEYSPSETRAGYFKKLEGSSTMAVRFDGTLNGIETHTVFTNTDVTAGTHYRFTFSSKPIPSIPGESGTITNPVDPTTGIGLNVNMKGQDVDGNIVVEEDLVNVKPEDRPGYQPGDEPENPDKPDPKPETTIDFKTDLSWDEPNAIVDGGTYVVTIKSEEPLAKLEVKIESDNEDFIASAGAMLPLEFDLATPPDGYADTFKNDLGLPVGDDVKGQNTVEFNISGLVPLLAGFPGTHTFTLSATDDKGGNLTKKLQFLAVE